MMNAATEEHIIETEALNKKAVVKYKNIIIGVTENALKMNEQDYDPVIYIPHEDINTEHLVESDFTSYCPYKGEAHYWHLVKNGRIIKENVAWQYQNPIADVTEIKNHLCFYKDLITLDIE